MFQPDDPIRVKDDDGQHLLGATGTFVKYRTEHERRMLRPESDCLVLLVTLGGRQTRLMKSECLEPFDSERLRQKEGDDRVERT